MNHRSVIAAVLGVGFLLGAAAPAAADPHWGHREHRGWERGWREHPHWRHERWEHRRPHYGYYQEGYGYAPSAYYAPPAVYLGVPGIGLHIR